MNIKKRVLLIEDNEALNKINQRALELEGYQVSTAQTIAQASVFIEEEPPDAIILDILLPDGSGIDFCKSIREQTSAPILFLTGVKGNNKILEGLHAGGDDYLTKPYSLELLTARITAFFRREQIAEKLKPTVKNMTTGNISLDLLSLKAVAGNRDLLLTPKEFNLLLFLIQNENTVFTAEQLYYEIWKQPMKGDPHAAKNVIYRLRKKLYEVDSGFYILTTRKKGYVLKRTDF